MDKKERNIWWGPPRRFDDKLQERKISWLELFYDLVYVAAIAQLTHHIALHPTWNSLGYVFFIFVLILWSWMNGSYYHDTHGSEGIRTRYFTLLQMLAVAAVTITLHDVFNGYHKSFAIAFAIIQGIITFLWWSAGYYDPSHKKLNRYYVMFYPVSIVLFILSVFTDFSTANILWGIALAINYGVVIISGPSVVKELKRRGVTYQTSASMVERFGLFTIIVLGENILGIVNGISDVHDKSSMIWITFMLAILIAFLLWWIFFDMTGDSEVKPGYNFFLLYNVLNIPLLGAFAASGASISMIVSETEMQTHNDVRYIFGIAVAVILLCIIGITYTLQQEDEEIPVMKKFCYMLYTAVIAILITTFFSNHLSGLTYLLVVAIILITPVYIGTRIWVRYRIFHDEKNNAI
ncbi:MAG: low temperature requirement protein A [Fimbriimonadaceae bacterium]|nr:low temperature requirement protein A [Chitinophagales bacterium]